MRPSGFYAAWSRPGVFLLLGSALRRALRSVSAQDWRDELGQLLGELFRTCSWKVERSALSAGRKMAVMIWNLSC